MPVYDVTLTIQDIDAATKQDAAAAFFGATAEQIASGEIMVEVQHEPQDRQAIDVSGDVAARNLRQHLPADPVLAAIRSRVKAHDDRMMRRAASPTGDDYNDVVAMVMENAPTNPVQEALQALTAAIRDDIRLHGRSDLSDPVFKALKAAESVLKGGA